jgi:hypothetical protein
VCVRTCVVPPGLRPISRCTQDLRPGLAYCAPQGLVSCRFCSTGVTGRVVLTHTLKAHIFAVLGGSAEAIPFPKPVFETSSGLEKASGATDWESNQPFTLILEKEITARPAVGRPIESAGRKVVKISRFFTCGSMALASSDCDRMR